MLDEEDEPGLDPFLSDEGDNKVLVEIIDNISFQYNEKHMKVAQMFYLSHF